MLQISYDVKDSKKTDSKVVLKALIEILVKKFKAFSIVRPVASTLRFSVKDAVSRKDVWTAISGLAGKRGVWYLASEIVESEDEEHWRYFESPDEMLQSDVDEIMQGIKARSGNNGDA